MLSSDKQLGFGSASHATNAKQEAHTHSSKIAGHSLSCMPVTINQELCDCACLCMLNCVLGMLAFVVPSLDKSAQLTLECAVEAR